MEFWMHSDILDISGVVRRDWGLSATMWYDACFPFLLPTTLITPNYPRFHHQALVELKILEALRRKDKDNSHNVVHMKDFFYFRNHLCITFELLGSDAFSLFHYKWLHNWQKRNWGQNTRIWMWYLMSRVGLIATQIERRLTSHSLPQLRLSPACIHTYAGLPGCSVLQ